MRDARALERSDVGFQECDSGGRAVRANRAFLSILGLKREELISLHANEVALRVVDHEGQDLHWFQRVTVRALVERRAFAHVRCGIYRGGDQEVTWVTITAVPFLDDWGRPTGVVTLLTLFDRELRSTAPFAAGRLRELAGRELAAPFAAALHDINNLLSEVVMGLELEMGHGPSTRVRDALSAASSAAELSRLAQGLTDEDPGEAVVELRELISQVMGRFQRTVAPELKVNQDFAAGPCWTRGKSAALESVLLNLALNAQRALRDVARPEIGVRLTPTRGGWKVELQDNGPGLSEVALRRLGSPYLRASGNGGGGRGLGLYSVTTTVEALGGRFDIRSGPDGVRCILLLVRAEPPQVERTNPGD